jgi:hypothetical protein
MTRFQQVVWRGDGRRRGQQKHPGWAGGWPTLRTHPGFLSHNEKRVPHPCVFCKGGLRCC